MLAFAGLEISSIVQILCATVHRPLRLVSSSWSQQYSNASLLPEHPAASL